MTYYTTESKLEDLERFRKASAAAVRRAKTDKEYARQFLEEIGYYEMMGTSPSASKASQKVETSKGKE